MGARGYYISAALIVALAASYFGGDLLKQSHDAQDALINLFAILAGVLVAVVSIVGDPSMLLPGNWRVGHEHAKDMQNRIANFSHLFFVYIVALLLLVVGMVVKDANIPHADFIYPLMTFFVVLGVLLSIPLPYSLMSIQKERMREEIKSRRNRGGEA
ncbi:hypothetical protein [Rhizobium ruizarguesonis]|uniref:hypothetical protein n=1 Tax=Rhizobium ruizarguesonis TaxID=2081791 RepID=UPI00102FA1F8|nr:hypothetical protein [Rhizobium ruizarguesonis]TAW18447.1 hypothetical protein ELI25_22940 [Rhizobium ruizarguesonis]TAZ54044.1 hypothetical protein ELH76_24240 [Rhizobium ruizarguesonis]